MGIKRRKIVTISSRLKAFGYFSDAFTSLSSSWKKLRGSWEATSGLGSTSTSASSYPLAVVKMSKSNVTASVKNTAPGTGIAIWATDSGNWWGVVTGQDAGSNCNCQTCSSCNAYQCNSYYYVCNQTNAYNCTPTGGGTCQGYNGISCSSYNGVNCCGYYSAPGNCKAYNKAGNCNAYYYSTSCTCYNSSFCAGWNTSNCNGYNAINYSCSGGNCASSSSYCNSSSCSSTSYYNCNCQTCYPATVRIIKSLSNTVSDITSWAVGTLVQSLKVITSGTGITIKAYSDNNLSTQIGSDLTYTANGATIDTQFGIVVAPSTYAQGSSIDDFTATTN